MSVVELIQRLRDDELAQITSEVRAGRVETILKALDERGRASELVEQQYTGRYPFELLQNADDAAVSRSGRVRFEATEHACWSETTGPGSGPTRSGRSVGSADRRRIRRSPSATRASGSSRSARSPTVRRSFR